MLWLLSLFIRSKHFWLQIVLILLKMNCKNQFFHTFQYRMAPQRGGGSNYVSIHNWQRGGQGIVCSQQFILWYIVSLVQKKLITIDLFFTPDNDDDNDSFGFLDSHNNVKISNSDFLDSDSLYSNSDDTAKAVKRNTNLRLRNRIAIPLDSQTAIAMPRNQTAIPQKVIAMVRLI